VADLFILEDLDTAIEGVSVHGYSLNGRLLSTEESVTVRTAIHGIQDGYHAQLASRPGMASDIEH
jgi:hypothetical protein